MEVYCCDEHGRFYIIRTIDGKRRPIAIALMALRDNNPELYEALSRKLLPMRKIWIQSGKDKSIKIEIPLVWSKDLMEMVNRLDVHVDVNKILSMVDSLRSEASKKAKLKLSPEAKIATAQETGEMIKYLFNMDIDTFLRKNLENISKYLSKEDAEFVREAIVAMIYESRSRMLILKEKLPEIHKCIEEALKSKPEAKCYNFNIIVVGSTTRLEATFDSDIEFLVYYHNRKDFMNCYKQYLSRKQDIEREISALLGASVQTRVACVEAFKDFYTIVTTDRAEKHAEWLSSILIDGEPLFEAINWKEYREKLAKQTRKKRGNLGLIEWITKRLSNPVIEKLHYAKAYHRGFSTITRAYIITKTKELSEIRATYNRPYWLVIEKLEKQDLTPIISQFLDAIKARIGKKVAGLPQENLSENLREFFGFH